MKILEIKNIKIIPFLFIISILSVLSLFYCKDAHLKTSGHTAIKIMWWGTQERHERTLKIIDMYKKLNPDTAILPVYTGWNGYYEKLATFAASNEMPDIIQITDETLPQFDEKNLLLDLTDIKTINTEGIYPEFKNFGKYNNKILGIPLGINAPCLVYNRSLFEKSLVSLPHNGWTWADLEKSSFYIYKKLGIYGIFNIALDHNDFNVYARQNGESLYSRDLKMPGFTKQTLMNFLKMCLRMQNNQAMENIKTGIEFRSNEENSSYAKEKTAMRFLWTNKIVSVRRVLEKDSEIMAYPTITSELGLSIKPSMLFSISKTSKYTEEAAKFINYFANDIEANKILMTERGITVFKNVKDAVYEKMDSQEKKICDYIEALKKSTDKTENYNYPVSDKVCKKIMQSVFEEVLFEKIDVDTAADKIIKEWKTALNYK